MSNLTKLEQNVLECIDHNEHGDYLDDAVWTWSVADNFKGDTNQLSGVVASLVKKGFVTTAESDGDSCLAMTATGVAVYLSHPDTEAEKHV